MKDRPEILVVDDDPNISRLEQLYLEKENYEVRTAADGNAAIAEFRRLPPDLILLDVMLPGVDGYEVLKTVRRSGNIPVIMVTARGETFDKVLCLELGADDYITKPFDGKEISVVFSSSPPWARRSTAFTRATSSLPSNGLVM